MTWKSKLPATELGWSKEMDSIIYVCVCLNLILSNNNEKKIKFMGKVGSKENKKILALSKILTFKKKSTKQITFAFKILLPHHI